ncbi:MAG: serine hydrolase domain-containing protein [Chloroflexota bacterium]
MQQNPEIIDTNMIHPPHDPLELTQVKPAYPTILDIPTPQWDRYFQAVLGETEGYAYAVARSGQVVSQGASGFVRSQYEPENPNVQWTDDKRINLASVSKPITAVAVLKFLEQHSNYSLDTTFYSLISNKIPQVGEGVDTVTIKNLLTQKSGLVPDGSLGGDLWPFLTEYLSNGLVGTPGETYAYSNTNFTILQAVIENITNQTYVDYVTQNILTPMNINASVFNATPDDENSATLSYNNLSDTRPGKYWSGLNFVAQGGWISSATELLKFLSGVRNNTVLPKATTDVMFTESLGWAHKDGLFGRYFFKDGELAWDNPPPLKQLNTCIVHFSNGYDAVLLINSKRGDVMQVPINAFEAQSPMLRYHVTSRCIDPNGNALYLSVQVFTKKPTRYSVVVATQNAPDTFQNWIPMKWLDQGSDKGFILMNPETNMVIVAPQNDAAVQVIPFADLVAGQRAFWKFVGSGYGAVQLQAHTKMNLNVSGSGPYYESGTAVLAYSWGRGPSNEMWTFSLQN